MSRSSLFLRIALLLPALGAQAADLPGLSFSHNDWEVVCDNTRTCRAAGYQSDDDKLAVSVLLTRKAGPRQPVTGELMIGTYDDEEALSKLPPVLQLSMRINGRALGKVELHKDEAAAKLSSEQVAALLAALPHKSSIEWAAGENRWRLSDKGAAAVLLKMDEFQGRIATQGALVKKGPQADDAVLAPLPMPVVIAAPLAKPLSTDKQLANDKAQALREALRAALKDDDCPDLTESEAGEAELAITRLTDTQLLVSTQCWTGAYNIGYGYWVVDDTSPYHAVLVTTSGSDYSDGSISASQKGRGLGDCWSSNAWTWDGKQFVHTESSTTGMCKLVAPGGAWVLPTLVTDVRHPPR